MEQWIKELENSCQRTGCRCIQGEALSRHTTFRVGGCADLFAEAFNAEQAAALWREAKNQAIPLRVLGKGSNLLVSDSGVSGLVLHLAPSEKSIVRENNVVRAWAGEALCALCSYALGEGLSGLEFAYGIPGSVGGAVYMNAGAYGGEIKDRLLWVRYLDESGEEHVSSAEELDLSYRHSFFTGKQCLILEAAFTLEEGDRETIKAKMDDVMERRRSKQPLEYPNAGSTFKRPEGAFASALIDGCGLKGHRVGGACVSQKHAGFLINDQKGSCCDILELIRQVQEIVREQTGFTLEREVEYWE